MKEVLTVILLFVLLMLSSCKTKYIVTEKEVPVEKIRTEYRTNTQVDSIYIHDSINVYSKGDTVFKDKVKLIYRDKIITDTILKTDTIDRPIYITNTEIKEVNKPTLAQKILVMGGFILFLSLIVLIIRKLSKYVL